MAESICRSLRDGALDGEHAPALSVADSLLSPFGSHVFDHLLLQLVSNIAASKSQSRGLVLVAYRRSPALYFDLLTSKGLVLSLLDKRVWILDCYTDPLGWRSRYAKSEGAEELSASKSSTVFRDVKDVSKLQALIFELAKGLVGQGKERITVAIDSVSDMLRHVSLLSVARLLANLRSHVRKQIKKNMNEGDAHAVFALRNYTLSYVTTIIASTLANHNSFIYVFYRALAALEYISSMVAKLEPVIQCTDGQRRGSENLISLEQNSERGKFNVQLKRRNGRVKLLSEEFHVEQTGIKFVALSSETTNIHQSLLPKVQFNLQLSEKERNDRAKVVLPFEHQGNGKSIQIYDGRQSLRDGQEDAHEMRLSLPEKINGDKRSAQGEIHYIRDSDDERPDSDEDPDDDLDI